jgi:pimeloyl-ACP methyl ester carboxylesterase
MSALIAPPAAGDACPPPLMWQDVRREFLSQSASQTMESTAGPVAVRSWGAGPPLYLLPAFASPAELYGLLIWLLRDEFHCVTVEPAEGNRPLSMADYADLVFAVADQRGDQKFTLFGANFGAAWALAAAERRPERIARLILLGGFAYRRLSLFEKGLAWYCRRSRRKLASLPGRALLQTENHRRWFPPFDATRWQYYLDASGAMPLRELARRAQAIRQFDLRTRLAEISVPTLLVRTEGDGRLSTACQEELQRGLPQATTEFLHTTGQLAYLTHPHRMAKLMRAFVGCGL